MKKPHAGVSCYSLETHTLPFRIDLVLDLCRVRIFKVSGLPVGTSSILDRQKSIANNFATLAGIESAMRVVRNQWESLDVVEEDLVIARTTACAECPHDIFEVVDVDIVAHQHDAVDRVADFVIEDQVANSFGKLLGRGLHLAEFCCVDLEGYPGDLEFKVGHCFGDGQAGFLTELANGRCGEGADHGVLEVISLGNLGGA